MFLPLPLPFLAWLIPLVLLVPATSLLHDPPRKGHSGMAWITAALVVAGVATIGLAWTGSAAANVVGIAFLVAALMARCLDELAHRS
jgi:hypothetical protein